MIIKKQGDSSDDLIAALFLALSPSAPCGFLPWPFPSLKSVGALSFEKSPRVQRYTRTKLLDFLPSQGSQGGGISKQKEKKNSLTLVQVQSTHFTFFLFPQSSILFPLLFYFYFVFLPLPFLSPTGVRST